MVLTDSGFLVGVSVPCPRSTGRGNPLSTVIPIPLVPLTRVTTPLYRRRCPDRMNPGLRTPTPRPDGEPLLHPPLFVSHPLLTFSVLPWRVSDGRGGRETGGTAEWKTNWNHVNRSHRNVANTYQCNVRPSHPISPTSLPAHHVLPCVGVRLWVEEDRCVRSP